MDFIRIKNFVLQRTPSIKRKDHLQNERKYLQIIFLIRDLYPKSIKKSKDERTNKMCYI